MLVSVKILVLDSTAVPGISEGPGSAAYFSRYVIDHLLDLGHEIVVTNHIDDYQLAIADVVWSEWCNEIAFDAARKGFCKKLIVRMRGYDVWMPLAQMPWKNVHALVYESLFLQDLAEEQPIGLADQVMTAIIPSGIDLSNIVYKPRASSKRVLALVARSTSDKGYQLAFEYARQRDDIELHVTTALSETNPRLLRYLQYTKPENVTIHGNVDTCTWLNAIGATHILSASIWETLGYTIAEGMAVGCKPLIHDAPGLKRNWPEEYLWTCFDDLDVLIDGPVESEVYRDYVEKQLSAKRGSEEFAKLVLE